MNVFKNVIDWSQISVNEKKNILSRPGVGKKSFVTKIVKKIIKDVRIKKDNALRKYTNLFDKVRIDNFKISSNKILRSSMKISEKVKEAIKNSKKNIENFHNSQKTVPVDIETQPGVRCQQIISPIDTVGIYIPGGSAPLISTVLMLAIPAYTVGCPRIVLCSPPNISNEILYAANVCNVKEIYQVGGAQAIAALAYGTETIPKVNKIFGPGNSYVTEAKLQVSNIVNGTSIDIMAGPSELMIIADEQANADFIAADLISQAEHGVDSQVFLITPSIKLATKVQKKLFLQLKRISRFKIVLESLNKSYLIIAKDLFECINISNMYAPEHLIIQTDMPRKLLRNVRNAGSIFLGPWSPESVGDYSSGTNHVLPTYGYTASQSGLSLKDFQKYTTVQELTSQGLLNISRTVATLAEVEQLDGHKNAVKIREAYLKEQRLC